MFLKFGNDPTTTSYIIPINTIQHKFIVESLAVFSKCRMTRVFIDKSLAPYCVPVAKSPGSSTIKIRLRMAKYYSNQVKCAKILDRRRYLLLVSSTGASFRRAAWPRGCSSDLDLGYEIWVVAQSVGCESVYYLIPSSASSAADTVSRSR